MLVIGAPAWRIAREHVLACLPEEACGVFLGQGDSVADAYPCRNCHQGDRTSRFEIEPQDLFDCARHARSNGLEMVAYYHSHPNGSGVFSDEDRRQAAPGSRHVILPVRAGEVLEPRGWRVNSP
jgi:proteasome lid subunit RPN8/RPN11